MSWSEGTSERTVEERKEASPHTHARRYTHARAHAHENTQTRTHARTHTHTHTHADCTSARRHVVGCRAAFPLGSHPTIPAKATCPPDTGHRSGQGTSPLMCASLCLSLFRVHQLFIAANIICCSCSTLFLLEAHAAPSCV